MFRHLHLAVRIIGRWKKLHKTIVAQAIIKVSGHQSCCMQMNADDVNQNRLAETELNCLINKG